MGLHWAFYPPANLAWWNLPRTELTASMANKVIKTCKRHCCNKAITAHVFRQLGFVNFWSPNFRLSTAPSKSLCLGQLAWAYLGFHCMKWQGVLLLSPAPPTPWLVDWMLVHCKDNPPVFHENPFILVGREKHWERRVFCPRTQHTDPARSWTWKFETRVQHTDSEATVED